MGEYYLEHHGILGQKWGVRRFQNPDGSLTETGKKRYSKMSSESIRKEFAKTIRNERRRRYGLAGRLDWRNAIGENSKKAISEQMKELDEIKNNGEFKSYLKKLRSLEKKFNFGIIKGEEFDKRWEEVKTDFFKTESGKRLNAAQAVRIGGKWTKEYVEGRGKDVTLAYLKDLGFNDEASEYVRSMLSKDLKVLG